MRTTLPIWACLLALSLAGASSADEVVLKNGAKLEGTVTEDGDKVMIDVGSGTITVDRSDVKSITKPDETIQEYDRRMQSLKPDDVNGHYQLHLWAKQQPGFKARADRLLQKVIELDPNHEQARRALGYVNYKGAWLTPDEHKAALGLVRYNGEWVSIEAAEKLRKIDQELALAQLKQAAEADRIQQRLALERQQITQRQRVLDMIRDGELPNIQSGVGLPWGLRYWGPAIGATQPPAD